MNTGCWWKNKCRRKNWQPRLKFFPTSAAQGRGRSPRSRGLGYAVERPIACHARDSPMTSNQRVTVFGAYGHTGRFVVSELRQRGWTPILSGRDPDKLNALGNVHPGLDLRPASVDDPSSLDRALARLNSCHQLRRTFRQNLRARDRSCVARADSILGYCGRDRGQRRYIRALRGSSTRGRHCDCARDGLLRRTR